MLARLLRGQTAQAPVIAIAIAIAIVPIKLHPLNLFVGARVSLLLPPVPSP